MKLSKPTCVTVLLLGKYLSPETFSSMKTMSPLLCAYLHPYPLQAQTMSRLPLGQRSLVLFLHYRREQIQQIYRQTSQAPAKTSPKILNLPHRLFNPPATLHRPLPTMLPHSRYLPQHLPHLQDRIGYGDFPDICMTSQPTSNLTPLPLYRRFQPNNSPINRFMRITTGRLL